MMMKDEPKEPQFQWTTFYDAFQGRVVSLCWPIRSVKEGTICTRNFIPASKSAKERINLSCAYFPDQLTLNSSHYQAAYDGLFDNDDALLASNATAEEEVYPEYLTLDGEGGQLKVYLDPGYVGLHWSSVKLSTVDFMLVSKRSEADIIWTFPDANRMDRNETDEDNGKKPWVNHFQGEQGYTVKKLLMSRLRRRYGMNGRDWMPKDYLDLNEETAAFLGAHYKQPSAWIAKPWNASRSEGCIVSDRLGELLKSLITGPKIVQRCNRFFPFTPFL